MRFEKRDLLDKKFKAIANNTRRKILILLKENPLNAGEISNHFTYSFASISHHLQVLKESGLVITKQNVNYKQYSLCTEAIEEIYLWLTNLMS